MGCNKHVQRGRQSRSDVFAVEFRRSLKKACDEVSVRENVPLVRNDIKHKSGKRVDQEGMTGFFNIANPTFVGFLPQH